MLQLIKKDIAIHKFSWFIYLAMVAVFMYAGNDVIFIIALMSAIITMHAFYADERANGHKLWNSLPFTRSEIVSARYLSLVITSFICMLFVVFFELIITGGLELTIWKEVIGGFILILFSSALCFPVIYLLSQKNVFFVLLILYVLLVIGGVHLFYYFYLYLTDTIIISGIFSDIQFFGLGLFLSFCLYSLSCGLSVKIYKKKEII